MVDGAFDPLHEGHIGYFDAATRLGLPLLCNLSGDEYVTRKHRPLLAASARARVLDALEQIDSVHVSDRSTAEVLAELRPKYYVKGEDWRGKLPPEELEVCEREGIEIVFLDTVSNSSTALLRSYTGPSLDEQVSAFEEFVLQQGQGEVEEYNEHYFVSDWRAHGNAYTIESRREIEGRNPELIRDVFQASSVLDAGCGPGALMYLLDELGVKADGMDFSPDSKKLAQPEISERIIIGSITDAPIADDSYELVICREVFEHLTVLEVQQAVAELARVTSGYVYVTTRFHPAPETLFDVTTEFEADPTHITCMNINLLRLMFVLQGMRRRLDLEQRMDWLNKGRVLVYEKVQAVERYGSE